MIGFGCTPAPYYTRDARCPGREGFHHGIDVDMPMRTPVYAGLSGVVVSTAQDGPAYGRQPVKLRVGGFDFLLGHLSRSFVHVGERVAAGRLLGLSGRSGAPDGPHLHFEVRPARASYLRAVDPRHWLDLVSSSATTPQRATALVLDGVAVALPSGGRQVITVKHTHGTFARAVLWQLVGGAWVRQARTDSARTGYGGLVPASRRRQGTGTTPLGTYPLASSFGSGPRRVTWSLPYERFDIFDYWVEDKASPYFNQLRDRREGGFRWWLPLRNPNGSERLADFARQYSLAVVIGFNDEQPVPRRGGGIFLHVSGSGATAGCVSAPRSFLATVLARLDPAQAPVIAIGR